jgi:uncharacterized membrane protein
MRTSAWLLGALAFGGAIVFGCGSDDPAAPAANGTPDSGVDSGGGPPTPNTPDTGNPETPEAGCAHRGDDALDGGAPPSVDGGGSPLVFFDVGAADRPISLSADGKIALIQDGVTGGVYFYDTNSGALTRKTTTGDPAYTLATALSGDGQHVSAYEGKDTIVAGEWNACDGWTATVHTGGCAGDPASGNPNNDSTAFDVNYDGTVIVGSTWNGCATVSAARWTRSGNAWTVKALDHLGMAGGNNRASFVSDDGSVIGGFAQSETADRVPAVWKADGSGVMLDPSGTTIGEVLSMSADGKMVAGPWNQTSNGGFYWTEAEGVVQIAMLADAQPQDQMWLNAISADKRVIFGSAGDPSFFSGGLGSMQAAVVWTKADGLRKLQEVLAAKSILLPDNWFLVNVLAASADGSTLLGTGVDMSGAFATFHTFVLRLDAAAY